MIKNLSIRNFKSIKNISLACQRINVFMGGPNTGKSNILEALGILSFAAYHEEPLAGFVRFQRVSNLFYDEILDQPIEIAFDNKAFRMGFADGRFEGTFTGDQNVFSRLRGDYGALGFSDGQTEPLQPMKFYRFAARENFDRPESNFLLPPSGRNLLILLLSRKELRATVNELFSQFGLRLGLRPQENKMEVIKQAEDVIISYPYSLSSDTLQRVVFYLCAIMSNEDSVLVYEEPESHAFPYYTKYLAETMALDQSNNQYFMSTHNPYLLLPLLEKCPQEEIAVFITYYEDYQTKIKPLRAEQVAEMSEMDPFSNIDRFLEEA